MWSTCNQSLYSRRDEGIIALIAFVVREFTAAAPAVDLRLFKDKTFLSATLISAVQSNRGNDRPSLLLLCLVRPLASQGPVKVPPPSGSGNAPRRKLMQRTAPAGSAA